MTTESTELARIEPWDEGPPDIHAPGILGGGRARQLFLPIAVTGRRPLTFAAENLPEGLAVDERTGVISGLVDRETEQTVLLTVRNAEGAASGEIRIAIGERIALTPPLGWNSWNCWNTTIDDAKVRASAKAMVAAGLAAHGYSYVNIDDCWQGERDPVSGALQPKRSTFPDMGALCDYVHGLGLRVGIYSTPWVTSYAGFPGGSSGEYVKSDEDRDRAVANGWYVGSEPHHRADARQWARWGVDYLKYDWFPWEVEEVAAMGAALAECGRDIVYSLSNSGPFAGAGDWARLANCWRTTGDIRDTWESVSKIGFSQDRWAPFAGPGHWNDPDMLVVGRLGWGEIRDNQLTVDEQVTHVTLWSLLAAPLLIGCVLTEMDDVTLRLLCNDEVLAIDQDILGRPARCVREQRQTAPGGRMTHYAHVYARPLADGSMAVGLFNRANEPADIEAAWPELDLVGPRRVRDVWARRDLDRADGRLRLRVPAHGARLLRLLK